MGPARRLYRAIELLARKSVGSTLWIQASYVYSSLRGNYDGIVRETSGQTQPGISSAFDWPQFQHNDYGRLYLDRTHNFRMDGSYTTPFHLFVGLQGYVHSSGVPLVPRGEAKTLPTLWEANVTVGYPIALGPATVTLQAYVLNLFNNQTEIQENQYCTNRMPAGYPATLYDPTVPCNNVNYSKILARQSPRILRGMVRVSF